VGPLMLRWIWRNCESLRTAMEVHFTVRLVDLHDNASAGRSHSLHILHTPHTDTAANRDNRSFDAACRLLAYGDCPNVRE